MATRESIEVRAERVLRLAELLKSQGKTWKQANNVIFSPTGAANVLFSTRAEREAFVNSPAYEKVEQVLASLDHDL